MIIDRRQILVSGTASLLGGAAAPVVGDHRREFPVGFLWGAATAGHQVEGNNINSDQWLFENVVPTLPLTPSGDACNSFELWEHDLELVKALNLNSYRFSIEWPRIEPEAGQFSMAMLDHYKAIIVACHARGIHPVVTLCHFTTPRWFAARGGWTCADSPALFARYCERTVRHLGDGIAYLATLNEPNDALLLQSVLPDQFWRGLRSALSACAKASGGAHFTLSNTVLPEDVGIVTANMLAAHRAARQAIKAVLPRLPVGVTLAVLDDQEAAPGSVRDARREIFYGPWLRAVREDDYVGVQNYERAVWDAHGKLPAPAGAPVNYVGTEVYPPSLGNAVRYVHAQAGVPVLVTEHGVATTDDRLRAALLPPALTGLRTAIDDGVPVLGYIHWSLLDNYEWGGDVRAQYGFHTVDKQTFRRTAKPSASIFAAIALKNRVGAA